MGRFLIVDDDTQIRDVLGRVLRREGYDVLTAATGAEALELVDRTSPDVLFLDIHLPGSDGLEVSKRLRERRACLCIVLMTGYGTPTTAIRAAQLEVFEYLNKPLDLQQVRSLARAALLTSRGKSLRGSPEGNGRAGSSCCPERAVVSGQSQPYW
jgi:DNA-binding NtrC family response regulator